MDGLDLDEHGFLLAAQLEELAEEKGWAELGLDVPVLVVSEAEASERADGSDLSSRATVERGSRSAVVTGGNPAKYRGKLAPLEKRPGNPFPHVISIGRALSCDVVLSLATVSKLQGYFRQQDGVWSFLDQRSLNGTLLNGTALQPNRLYPLADGDELSIAEEVVLTFLLPASLERRLATISAAARDDATS